MSNFTSIGAAVAALGEGKALSFINKQAAADAYRKAYGKRKRATIAALQARVRELEAATIDPAEVDDEDLETLTAPEGQTQTA